MSRGLLESKTEHRNRNIEANDSCPSSKKINGENVRRRRNFRLGHNHRIEGSDLVVWIKRESTEPITVSLSPAGD